MWNPFRPKSQPKLPSDWKSLLTECNFELAREELNDYFDRANQIARASGQDVVYRAEFGEAWQRFAKNPRFETAVPLIESSPPILQYFLECCPNGKFAFYDRFLGKLGKPNE